MGDPLPGRVVKDDPRNPKQEVGSFLERELSAASAANDSTAAPNRAAFHRKPARVQRGCPDITIASPAKAKFRMTSDRYITPTTHRATDRVAMNAIRESGRPNTAEVRGGQLLYARRLVADKGCLTCHGAPAAAPAAVKALYPRPQGYGYEEGKARRRDQRGDPAGFQPGQFRAALRQRGVAGPRGDGPGGPRPAAVHPPAGDRAGTPGAGVRAGGSQRRNRAPASPKVDFIEGEHVSRNEIHELNTAVKAMHLHRVPVPPDEQTLRITMETPDFATIAGMLAIYLHRARPRHRGGGRGLRRFRHLCAGAHRHGNAGKAAAVATIALVVLWITGLAVIGMDTGFDTGLLATKPKLLAKLTVVAVLTVNSLGLHLLAFPRMARPEPTRARRPCCQ